MFTIQSELPLPAPTHNRYTGFAYDGVSYYFTNGCDCKIDQYGQRFQYTGRFGTVRGYAALCYDFKEHCFWAASDEYPAAVFKLNSRFEEVDYFDIHASGQYGGAELVKGLSYDLARDRLIIAFASCLVGVDKSRREESTLLAKACKEWFLGALSVDPYYLCCSTTGDCQLIKIISPGGEPRKVLRLPLTDTIESAVYLPSGDDSQRLHLMALVTRRRSQSIVWDCVLPCDALNPPFCPRFDAPCEAQAEGRELSREQKEPEFLDSLARLEKSLSGLLLAEGDRLHKVLESSDDPSVILEANRSVYAAIVRATHLELVVYDILSALEDACRPIP